MGVKKNEKKGWKRLNMGKNTILNFFFPILKRPGDGRFTLDVTMSWFSSDSILVNNRSSSIKAVQPNSAASHVALTILCKEPSFVSSTCSRTTASWKKIKVPIQFHSYIYHCRGIVIWWWPVPVSIGWVCRDLVYQDQWYPLPLECPLKDFERFKFNHWNVIELSLNK